MSYLEEIKEAYLVGDHPMLNPAHVELFRTKEFTSKLEKELETERPLLLDTPALIALRLGIPDFGLAVAMEKERISPRLEKHSEDIQAQYFDDLPRRGRFMPGDTVPTFSRSYSKESFEESFGINKIEDRRAPTFNGKYTPVGGRYFMYKGVPVLVPEVYSRKFRLVLQYKGIIRVFASPKLRYPECEGEVTFTKPPQIVCLPSREKTTRSKPKPNKSKPTPLI